MTRNDNISKIDSSLSVNCGLL